MRIPDRIILSRKGFDSRYGGCASPILPDGRMISIPIPEEGNTLQYNDVPGPPGIRNLGYLVNRLGAQVNPDMGIHLDPDLRRELLPGVTNWRPLFGQCAAAQRHLEKNKVAGNDLFLFFGWFRRVDNNLKYEKSAADEHVIWGWLQVDHSFEPGTESFHWASHHPHLTNRNRKYNHVYVGRRFLSFMSRKPGAGVFHYYRPDLRLTHPDHDRRRSFWCLPNFFSSSPFTYHSKARWEDTPNSGLKAVQSAKIGQEFILSTTEHQLEVGEWLERLFAIISDGKSY